MAATLAVTFAQIGSTGYRSIKKIALNYFSAQKVIVISAFKALLLHQELGLFEYVQGDYPGCDFRDGVSGGSNAARAA